MINVEKILEITLIKEKY